MHDTDKVTLTAYLATLIYAQQQVTKQRAVEHALGILDEAQHQIAEINKREMAELLASDPGPLGNVG